MKTQILSSLLLLLIYCTCSAQELKVDWINQYNSVGSCIIESKCIDSIGNIYYGGTFKGEANIKFGKDSVSLVSSYYTDNNTSGFTTDFFISKVDKDGHLIWIKKYSSIKNDAFSKIILDSSQNLIVVGSSGDNLDFDPDPNKTKNVYGNFMLRLSKDGNFLNVYSLPFNDVSALKTNSIGDIFLTGFVSAGIVDFDVTDSIYKVNTNGQSFILKFDNNLKLKWVKLFGNPYSSIQFRDLTISNKNQIIISGEFSGGIDFDPSNKYYELSSQGSAFILKLDVNGDFLWAKSLTKSTNSGSSSYCNNSYIDNSENIYSIGYFSGDISVENITIKSVSNKNVFISKLSSSGTLIWLKQLKSKSNGITPHRIIGDSQNHLFLFGQVQSDEVSLVPDSDQYIHFKGAEFILFLDENGNYLKYDTISCLYDFDVSDAQIVNNNIFLNGYYIQTAVFNFDVNIPKLSAPNFGGYIGKLIYCFTSRSTLNINSCNYYNWSLNGNTYIKSGVYYDTLVNNNGCDSIVTLNLNIKKSSYSILNKSVCNSYLAPNGQTISKSGSYTITIPNKVGCDSIITLNLIIINKSFSTINPFFCDSYIAPNGQVLNNSGLYTITIPNKAGCDSIITINLTIKKKSFSTITKSVCDFYKSPSGQFFTKSGTYSIIIPNNVGCDSIITLNLIINTLKLGVIEGITSCPGDEVTLLAQGASLYYWDKSVINGIPFIPSKSDTYTVIGEDLNGCRDTSTVKVNLLNPIIIQILNKNKDFICQGNSFELTSISQNVSHYQWKLNGLDLDTIGATSSNLTSKKAGDYSLIVKSNQGCSASSNILTVNITPRPTINTIHSQTICLGDRIQLLATNAYNYLWSTGNKNGDYVTPTSSSKYCVTTIDSVSGCVNSDSMFVKVNLPTKSTISTTSLGTFTLNNISYDKSGQYVQTLKNVVGCDSTITINLVVEKLALDELKEEKLFIYPNPTNDGFLYLSKDLEIEKVILMDYNSKKIQTYDSIGKINLSQYSKGIYFLEIQTSKGFIRVFKILFE